MVRTAFCILAFLFVTASVSAQGVEMSEKFSSKFKEKIEKVVVGQILEAIRDQDYDTYRMLKGFWMGIRDQSMSAVTAEMKNMLIEKGFAYMLYFSTKSSAHPPLALFMMGNRFMDILVEKYPVYAGLFQFVFSDWLLLTVQEMGPYVDAGALYEFYQYSLENVLDVYKAVVGENRTPTDDEYQDMAVKFMRGIQEAQQYEFARQMDLTDPESVKRFIVSFEKFFRGFRRMAPLLVFGEGGADAGDPSELLSEEYVKKGLYRSWFTPGVMDAATLDAVYYEITSFFIRMTMPQLSQDKASRDIGNFQALAAALGRMYPETPPKGVTLPALKAHALEMLARTKADKSASVYWGFIYLLLANMEINADKIAGAMREGGSYFKLMTPQNIEALFVDFPYRSSFLTANLKGVIKPASYTSEMLQVVAMLADYIQSQDAAGLSEHFRQFALRTIDARLADARQNAMDSFKRELAAAGGDVRTLSGDHFAFKYLDMTLVIDLVRYYLGGSTDSAFMNGMRAYIETRTGGSIDSPESAREVKKWLGSTGGAFARAPVLQDLMMRVVVSLRKLGEGQANVAGLMEDLKKLLPQVALELLSLGKESFAVPTGLPGGAPGADKEFSMQKDIFGVVVPVVGLSIGALIEMLADSNTGDLKRIASAAFARTVKENIMKLDPKVRAVILPFTDMGIRYLVYNEQVTMREFTAIAMEILNLLSRESRALYVAVGFSFGQFADMNGGSLFSAEPGKSAAKLYLADKVGMDFVGLGTDLAGHPAVPWRAGIFVGGFFDFLVSELGTLDTRNQPGGRSYLKTGVFVSFDSPVNSLLRFDLSGGVALDFTWKNPALFLALSWNILELADLF